jgi:uncharacterized glyoxalase superfamily protein PhnB
MNVTAVTPILNVSDVPASIAWFERLGWRRAFAWNDGGPISDAANHNDSGPAQFGGVCCGQHSIFLCHNGQGSRGGTSPRYPGDDDTGGVWMSWSLKSAADVDAAHELALRNGITVSWPPTDEPWGLRECHIVHPDGHTIRLAGGLPENEGD